MPAHRDAPVVFVEAVERIARAAARPGLRSSLPPPPETIAPLPFEPRARRAALASLLPDRAA